MKIYENIEEIIEENKKKYKLIGVGSFSYGASEYWKLVNETINELIKRHDKIDIYIEEAEPAIRELNKYIKREKKKMRIIKRYAGMNIYPLKDYISNRYNDSLEFISFIEKLRKINEGEEREVNIYGVDVPIKNNKIDLIQYINQEEEFWRRYPEYIKEEYEYGEYTRDKIRKNKRIKKREKYMSEAIKYLMEKNKNIGVFIGHNENVMVKKIGNYKTTGYRMKKELREKYITIGTSGMKGYVRYEGEYIESEDRNEVAPIFKIYKKPEKKIFIDNGTLVNYIKNNVKNIVRRVIYKPPDINLSYLSIGYIKLQDYDEKDYKYADEFDYMVTYEVINPLNNYIVTIEK